MQTFFKELEGDLYSILELISKEKEYNGKLLKQKIEEKYKTLLLKLNEFVLRGKYLLGIDNTELKIVEELFGELQINLVNITLESEEGTGQQAQTNIDLASLTDDVSKAVTTVYNFSQIINNDFNTLNAKKLQWFANKFDLIKPQLEDYTPETKKLLYTLDYNLLTSLIDFDLTISNEQSRQIQSLSDIADYAQRVEKKSDDLDHCNLIERLHEKVLVLQYKIVTRFEQNKQSYFYSHEFNDKQVSPQEVKDKVKKLKNYIDKVDYHYLDKFSGKEHRSKSKIKNGSKEKNQSKSIIH